MKKIHQYLGLLMLLPFIAWAVTGVFFFIKPGYQAAYESLPVKTYALGELPSITGQSGWSELRWMRSILGAHLLVKINDKWQQINPETLQPALQPTEQQMRLLINDAIKINPQRYGDIQTLKGLNITTDTQISISVNWPQMRIHQSGADTDLINQMYKIHYLQWTGIKTIDKVLGILGLGIVVMLAMLGLIMTIRQRAR
jgi:hypothetical protein